MNSNRGLQGKVIIITGGCGDIGSATTHKLAALGARVVVWDIIEKEAGEDLAKDLGGVEYGQVDQGDAAQVHDGIADVGRRFGWIDIVIGNAAYLPALGRLFDRSATDWRESFRINVIGCAMLAQAAIKIMLQQTPDVDGVRGEVLFTSSWVGTHPYPGSIDYCVSKAALDHLTRLVAQEYAARGILVNAVSRASLMPARPARRSHRSRNC
jgi:ketoreductase RED2